MENKYLVFKIIDFFCYRIRLTDWLFNLFGLLIFQPGLGQTRKSGIRR